LKFEISSPFETFRPSKLGSGKLIVVILAVVAAASSIINSKSDPAEEDPLASDVYDSAAIDGLRQGGGWASERE